jgi:hypothetical protein
MSFLYTVLTPTGGVVGKTELGQPASGGEEIRDRDDRPLRIIGVVPVDRIEELVGRRPSYGIILVAPVRDIDRSGKACPAHPRLEEQATRLPQKAAFR